MDSSNSVCSGSSKSSGGSTSSRNVAPSASINDNPSNIPWLFCVLCIPVTLGGYSYSFGIYSNALKESLALTQPEITTISSAIFCAGIFKWVPGLIVDRYGTRASILAGGIFAAIALVLYGCIAKQIISVDFFSAAHNGSVISSQPTSRMYAERVVPILSFLGLFIFLCQSLISGAVFKTIASVCHGPGSRGTVVGIGKGFTGMGAGTFAVLFQALRRESDLDLLFMAAVLFFVLSVIIPWLTLPTTAPTTKKEGGIRKSRAPGESALLNSCVDHLTPRHFKLLYAGQFALACYVVGQSLMTLQRPDEGESSADDPDGELVGHPDYLRLLTILIVWLGPIIGILYIPKASYSQLPTTALNAKGDKAENNERSFTLIQLIQTVPAWLLLWTCTILAGAGALVTQNLGQMVLALELNEKVIPVAVALFSVANSSARILTGAISEIVLERGYPRPILILNASIAGCIAHAFLALASTRFSFLVGVAFAGFAYGMIWPLMVLVVGDIFGPKYLAGNYLFFEGVIIAAGTILLSKGISQAVYQSHLQPGASVCVGHGCFQLTHWITAAFCMTSTVTTVLLLCTKLTRQAYSNGLAHEN